MKLFFLFQLTSLREEVESNQAVLNPRLTQIESKLCRNKVFIFISFHISLGRNTSNLLYFLVLDIFF